MIFCAHCGQTLYGETINGKTRSYRHRKWLFKRGQKILLKCDRQFTHINSEMVEDAILVHLFSIFGDLPEIEKAAKEALPEIKERERLKSKAGRLQKERSDLKRANMNLVQAIEDGEYSETLATRLKENEIRESRIENELKEVKIRIAAIPSEEDIKQSAARNRNIYKMLLQSGKRLQKMMPDDRKKLFQVVFDGFDEKDNRLGVYIRKDNKHPERLWFYEIRGRMVNEFGRLPMPVNEMQARLGIHGDCDPEFNPLKHDSPWFPNNKLTTENSGFRVTSWAR
jgi:hypothetical protein